MNGPGEWRTVTHSWRRSTQFLSRKLSWPELVCPQRAETLSLMAQSLHIYEILSSWLWKSGVGTLGQLNLSLLCADQTDISPLTNALKIAADHPGPELLLGEFNVPGISLFIFSQITYLLFPPVYECSATQSDQQSFWSCLYDWTNPCTRVHRKQTISCGPLQLCREFSVSSSSAPIQPYHTATRDRPFYITLSQKLYSFFPSTDPKSAAK